MATLSPAVIYSDPLTAVAWLQKAFGFKLGTLVKTPNDEFAHAALTIGDGTIHVGSEWSTETASPQSVGGKNTQSVRVHLDSGIDAHCRHAEAAGAQIVQSLQDEFFGERTYRAKDLEGHVWVFSQRLRDVSIAEMQRVSGLKIEGDGR